MAPWTTTVRASPHAFLGQPFERCVTSVTRAHVVREAVPEPILIGVFRDLGSGERIGAKCKRRK